MGHASRAAFRPYCAAVAAKVAPVLIIKAAAFTPSARAIIPLMPLVMSATALYAIKAATRPYTMGLIQDQFSTTKEAPLMRRSRTPVATVASMASPLIAPLMTVLNWALLATWLSLVSTGSKAARAVFFIFVAIWAQVMGILSNLALISSAEANMAFFTTSAVTRPCSAYCLMEPSAMPM